MPKIRFFGDSWYWCWYTKNQLKSNAVQSKFYNPDVFAFPAFDCFLNFLNYSCINHCAAGKDFYQTVDTITNITEHDDIIYNVVFFSSLVRRVNLKENLDKVTNYKNFIDNFNDGTIKLLQKIQDWAEKNNQQILLVGGQCTLYRSVFDKVPHKTNLHLLSECIISTLIEKDKPFGIFKLSNDISDNVDKFWDKRLVNQIYEEQQEFNTDANNKVFTFPDFGHLNLVGALFLADLILHKIEELQEKKI